MHKRTPLHGELAARGAVFRRAGPWLRARHFGEDRRRGRCRRGSPRPGARRDPGRPPQRGPAGRLAARQVPHLRAGRAPGAAARLHLRHAPGRPRSMHLLGDVQRHGPPDGRWRHRQGRRERLLLHDQLRARGRHGRVAAVPHAPRPVGLPPRQTSPTRSRRSTSRAPTLSGSSAGSPRTMCRTPRCRTWAAAASAWGISGRNRSPGHLGASG